MNSESRLEQIAGMAILLLLVIGCFVVLRPFVSALLLALILSYSTFPVYAWCERLLKGRRGLAATLMTLLVALFLLVPLIVLGSSLAEQIAVAIRWSRRLIAEGPPGPPGWIANIPVVGPQLYEYWQAFVSNTAQFLNEIVNAKLISDLGQYLLSAGEFLMIGAAVVAQGTLQLAFALFIAFFFYRDGVDSAKGLQNVAHRLGGERGTSSARCCRRDHQECRLWNHRNGDRSVDFDYFGTLAGRGARCVAAWVYHLLAGPDSHRRAPGVVPCSDLVILHRCNRMGGFLSAMGHFRCRRRRQYHQALFYQPR